jgi:CubicO group peptidase (beta-lactamase class C family)
MDAAEQVVRFLAERVDDGDFPAAVALVREAGEERLAVAVGNAVVTPELIPASVDTIFDLASLTKPLATTLLAAMAAEDGLLDLDAPAVRWLPELGRESILVRHLLSHTSGLPKWVPFYALVPQPGQLPAALGSLQLEAPAGERVVYGDPNFIAAGLVLERLYGERLDALFNERVARRLGLMDVGYLPQASALRRIAASETGNVYERSLAGEMAAGYDGWRTGLIWGQVHDGNAYFMGGVAGHAGLFGTARAVAALAEQFMVGSKLLYGAPSAFTTNLTPGLDEHRSLGWMLASTPGCSAGPSLPPHAFGHTGFTGTSVWIDPDRRAVYVLLTNRTHPTYRSQEMCAIRQRFHSLVAG